MAHHEAVHVLLGAVLVPLAHVDKTCVFEPLAKAALEKRKKTGIKERRDQVALPQKKT